MIQFNLLPEVKQAYIRTRRTKRMVLLSASGFTVLMVGIMILLFLVVNVFQKTHLNDLNKDIKKYSSDLQNTQDLNKILTIQNQLNSLTALHNKKVVASRLFTYVGQFTPNQVSIGKFDIDFSAATIAISGTANDLGMVNKFADTLKFTDYKTGDNQTKKAFSNVVLANFTRDDKKTQYQLNVSFDPTIFDSANDIVLNVPSIVSTRSTTEKPSALFEQLDGAGH